MTITTTTTTTTRKRNKGGRPKIQNRKCALCHSTKTYTDRNKWEEWYRHPALNMYICSKCYRANKRKNSKKKKT